MIEPLEPHLPWMDVHHATEDVTERNALARHLLEHGEYAEASDILVEAWKSDRRLLTGADLAAVNHNLGRVWIRWGKRTAVLFLRDAVLIHRRLGDGYAVNLAESLAALAVAERLSERPAAAIAAMDEAVALYRDASHRPGLAATLVGQGVLLHALADGDRALLGRAAAALREAAGIFEVLGDDASRDVALRGLSVVRGAAGPAA